MEKPLNPGPGWPRCPQGLAALSLDRTRWTKGPNSLPLPWAPDGKRGAPHHSGDPCVPWGRRAEVEQKAEHLESEPGPQGLTHLSGTPFPAGGFRPAGGADTREECEAGSRHPSVVVVPGGHPRAALSQDGRWAPRCGRLWDTLGVAGLKGATPHAPGGLSSPTGCVAVSRHWPPVGQRQTQPPARGCRWRCRGGREAGRGRGRREVDARAPPRAPGLRGSGQ